MPPQETRNQIIDTFMEFVDQSYSSAVSDEFARTVAEAIDTGTMPTNVPILKQFLSIKVRNSQRADLQDPEYEGPIQIYG